MTIQLDVIPPKSTAQQKGVSVWGGHPHFFTKEKVREAENFLAGLLKPYKPAQPFAEPVSVAVVFCFPYRKSEKKSITRAEIQVPHYTRPDLDNLEKGLLDTLTRLGFWTDDGLIWRKITHKLRGPSPYIRIKITPYTEEYPTTETTKGTK